MKNICGSIFYTYCILFVFTAFGMKKQDFNKSLNIQIFPKELHLEIVKNASDKDLQQTRSINKYFYSIVQNDNFYSRLIRDKAFYQYAKSESYYRIVTDQSTTEVKLKTDQRISNPDCHEQKFLDAALSIGHNREALKELPVISQDVDSEIEIKQKTVLGKTYTFIWLNKNIKTCNIPELIHNTFAQYPKNSKFIIGKEDDNNEFCFFDQENQKKVKTISDTFFTLRAKKNNKNEPIHDAISVVDSSGKNLLHYACYQRDIKLIQSLLPYIHKNSLDIMNKSPLDIAIRRTTDNYHEGTPKIGELSDQLKFFKDLQQYWLFNSKNIYGSTPLHIAAKNNLLNLTNFLIQQSEVDLFEKNQKGRIFVHEALYSKARNPIFVRSCIKLILSKDNCPSLAELVDSDGNTLMHMLCENNTKFSHRLTVFEEIVRLLIQKDENLLTQVNNKGETPYDNLNNDENIHEGIKLTFHRIVTDPSARNKFIKDEQM